MCLRPLAVGWTLLAASVAVAADGPMAFVGATLIDGTGAPPLANAAIVVRGERIEAVGPRAEVAVPVGTERVDVAGRWIVPGLIDGHVHFFQSGGLYARPDIIDLRSQRSYADEIAAIRSALPETLARYLASGVTSVVDVGGPLWNLEVRALAERSPLAPRVAVAGPLLGTYAPVALTSDDPAIVRIEASAAARAEVRRQLAAGVDLVKIWFVFPEADLAPDLEWVRAAIDEAHAGGARVVAHATQLRVARAVVEAGADILAHSIDDAPLDAETLALMRERGLIYTTTLLVRPRYRAVFGRHLALTEIEGRTGDPAVIGTFGDLDRLPPALRPSWLRRTSPAPLEPTVAANLRAVQDAGIVIAAGSDAGNIGTLHGPSLHAELALMVEAGLTPMQALVAATRGGAAVMGRDDLGTVAPGKLADFLILDADPLADIANTQRLGRVVKNGNLFDPAAIRRDLP